MPGRPHHSHGHHDPTLMLPQIEMGNFGFWTWPGRIDPAAQRAGSSQLLVVTDAPTSDPAPQGRAAANAAATAPGFPTTMVGFVRLYTESDQRWEDWRQPPGGYPDRFWMFPYYSESPIYRLVQAYFNQLGLLGNQSDSWEQTFPHSDPFPWAGFSEQAQNLAWTEDRFRVVRHFVNPEDTTGRPSLLHSGAPLGGGTWHMGPETWFSPDRMTVRLEMDHHLQMEHLSPGQGLMYAAQPIAPGGNPPMQGGDPGARRSARRLDRRVR